MEKVNFTILKAKSLLNVKVCKNLKFTLRHRRRNFTEYVFCPYMQVCQCRLQALIFPLIWSRVENYQREVQRDFFFFFYKKFWFHFFWGPPPPQLQCRT